MNNDRCLLRQSAAMFAIANMDVAEDPAGFYEEH